MDDLFDDPGDLGFFWDEEAELELEEAMDDLFYVPAPGEEEDDV